ncbi:4-hydroxy-tetrahydrodipicolinate reductase [Peristeroidobacter soli]|uniref:4-hydroxy-tetrahydrodipicolinate reductase n=1 Tax=Peristeroidobacter soli TaxID=2497877 RepID=UPI00101CF144|nr:4-hydroxy-tetrahydrodipicolinate reductase [Peristeroidobacter soli]
MSIRICLAGITGDVGRLLATEILAHDDLTLAAAVARSAAGQKVGQVLGCDCEVEIRASVVEALASDSFDVLVDYTSATAAFENVRAAIAGGKHVIVGSSGITAEQYAQLDEEARRAKVGVVHGNFAITAVLAQVFATAAAKYIKSWEIIEYAHDDKIDAISGTARELANRMASQGPSQHAIAADDFVGDSRSRGATVQGTQVHAVRLPGHVFGFEVIFGRSHERLIIRHEAGSHAEPYISGTLLAIKAVPRLVGLHQGLESILDLKLDR